MNKTGEVRQWRRWCDEEMHKLNGKWMRWICTMEIAQAYIKFCINYCIKNDITYRAMNKARWKLWDSLNGQWNRRNGEMVGKWRRYGEQFFGWKYVIMKKVGWTLSPCEALKSAFLTILSPPKKITRYQSTIHLFCGDQTICFRLLESLKQGEVISVVMAG